MKVVFLIFAFIIAPICASAQNPFPEILSPKNGDVIYGSKVTVEFKLNNEANRNLLDVQHLYLKLDHATCLYTNGFSGSHTFGNLSPGERSFYIQMEDSNFFQVGDTTEVIVTLLSNDKAPSTIIVSPKSESLIKQSDITVKYSISAG
ncbi:MAG: hypothetical protein KDD56_10450, partial [Bdellovibrionales bacterium]|nr:hypothetical protein [Bdellovibrionales bacterium]